MNRQPLDERFGVSCKETDGGWTCHATVGPEPGATTHLVRVTRDDLNRFAPSGTSVERLVDASFAFLLEREPRESILGRFDLPVIERYFPEYGGEIRRRLGG